VAAKKKKRREKRGFFPGYLFISSLFFAFLCALRELIALDKHLFDTAAIGHAQHGDGEVTVMEAVPGVREVAEHLKRPAADGVALGGEALLVKPHELGKVGDDHRAVKLVFILAALHKLVLDGVRLIPDIADYLLRRQGLTLEEMASVIAAPFWSTIRTREPAAARQLTYLRTIYPSLLITGPFSIILGFNGGLMALNDRLKLRSMVVGEKDDRVFISSEEAAIRVMEPDAENIWAPMGGEPVIVRLKEGTY